jgi:hypothetical protein
MKTTGQLAKEHLRGAVPSPHELRVLAAEAVVDPRTAQKWWDGGTVSSTCAAVLEKAAAKLGWLKTSHQPAAEPDRKDFFIEVLAEYLVKDQATRSIRLEMGDSEAKMWAKVRGATPLFGYPTQAEAVKLLREWLLGRG